MWTAPLGRARQRGILLRGGAVSLALGLIVLSSWSADAAEGDVLVTEGDSGTVEATFVISLSVPESVTVTVPYFTSDGTASAGTDYESVRGEVTFLPGETVKLVDVPVRGDKVPEGNETFYFNLPGSQAVGTIVDDDPLISIAGVTVTEGDEGEVDATFVVTLSVGKPRPLEVRFATADGTATGGIDYETKHGTLRFAPGERSKIIKVTVVGDRVPERDETFFVNLSEPSSGQIATVQGMGIILNDDAVAFTGETPPTTAFTPTAAIPGPPVPPGALPRRVKGVRSVTSSGDVVVFGEGSTYKTEALELNEPVVGASTTASQEGYWLVASDGGIFAFGDARFHGSTGSLTLNRPIVGMAATPSGQGYWLMTGDGSLYPFGDAPAFVAQEAPPGGQSVVAIAP